MRNAQCGFTQGEHSQRWKFLRSVVEHICWDRPLRHKFEVGTLDAHDARIDTRGLLDLVQYAIHP